MASSGDITMLLKRISAGDRSAEEQLVPRVYQDLRRLAAVYLRHERPDHTLQPTALVHEAYLRLTGRAAIQWQDRVHFFRIAASTMRRILVDHARNNKAGKRGGGALKIPLQDCMGPATGLDRTVLDLDQALERLSNLDERQAQIVEMRFFAGLSEEEIASALCLSTRTIKREWAMARAWLRGELVN
jgi:RNA polymerase sigma factor (TIGR02999 family)